ncbi:alcohol dehydrogenase catalytic domain-containing protein [Micromonospora arida]|uniref:alcohol dehydrogenase catalytic domain-containing protein n=1 Tax=Micromonospora arida TaxID=2203715 RepID=UPI0033D5F45E
MLLRIVASGVNPLDTKIQAGKAAHARVELPAVLGLDLAGVVAAVGAEVTDFEPGGEVYGLCGGVDGASGRCRGVPEAKCSVAERLGQFARVLHVG